MMYVLALGGGSFLGGMLLVSLIAWLLGKITAEPAPARFFFGWICCSLFGVLQMSNEGLPTIIIAVVAYGLAAIVACALAMKETPSKDEIETFE
jgi:uncharacterized membrane protein